MERISRFLTAKPRKNPWRGGKTGSIKLQIDQRGSNSRASFSISLPLKPKAWNQATLALKGDTLTLRLNGEPIHERTIERSSSRLFGLFHFADETEVRVRNVTYRGDWPHRLPESLTRVRAR